MLRFIMVGIICFFASTASAESFVELYKGTLNGDVLILADGVSESGEQIITPLPVEEFCQSRKMIICAKSAAQKIKGLLTHKPFTVTLHEGLTKELTGEELDELKKVFPEKTEFLISKGE